MIVEQLANIYSCQGLPAVAGASIHRASAAVSESGSPISKAQNCLDPSQSVWAFMLRAVPLNDGHAIAECMLRLLPGLCDGEVHYGQSGRALPGAMIFLLTYAPSAVFNPNIKAR